MKRFELPAIEINTFSVENVITTSGGYDPTVTNTLSSGTGDAAGSGIVSDIATYYIDYGAVDMGA